jgi:hypothetical protein
MLPDTGRVLLSRRRETLPRRPSARERARLPDWAGVGPESRLHPWPLLCCRPYRARSLTNKAEYSTGSVHVVFLARQSRPCVEHISQISQERNDFALRQQ